MSLPIGRVEMENFPESLKNFIETANKLSLDRNAVKFVPQMKLSNQLKKGMKSKVKKKKKNIFVNLKNVKKKKKFFC